MSRLTKIVILLLFLCARCVNTGLPGQQAADWLRQSIRSIQARTLREGQQIHWREEIFWTTGVKPGEVHRLQPRPVVIRNVSVYFGKFDRWRIGVVDNPGRRPRYRYLARCGDGVWKGFGGVVTLHGIDAVAGAESRLRFRRMGFGYLTTGGLHLIELQGLELKTANVNGDVWTATASSKTISIKYRGRVLKRDDSENLVLVDSALYDKSDTPGQEGIRFEFGSWKPMHGVGYIAEQCVSYDESGGLLNVHSLLAHGSLSEKQVESITDTPRTGENDVLRGVQWEAVLDGTTGRVDSTSERRDMSTIVVVVLGWCLGLIAILDVARRRR